MKKRIFILSFFLFFVSFFSVALAADSVSQNENVQSGSSTSAGSAATTNSTTSSTTSSTTTSSSTDFANPLGSVTSVSALLSSVLNNLMGIIAIIAVVFIVIGGIMYVTSGGNETMVKRAKGTWTGAVIGLAIAMAAPTFLKTIKTILGGNSNTGTSADDWVNRALSLNDIAVNVLNLLLSIFGVIAMISMVVGGIMYLTSGGDPKRTDSGKDIFKYSLLGIIVALSAVIVIKTINGLLSGTL